jgi:hypothetical protein
MAHIIMIGVGFTKIQINNTIKGVSSLKRRLLHIGSIGATRSNETPHAMV